MGYTALTCPKCGAAVESVPDRGSFFCQYCGARIVKDKQFVEVSGNVTVGGMASEASLLERGFLFLEDGDFENADAYFEKVLDINPKCSNAYLGKLMVDIKAKDPDALSIGFYHPVEKNEYFKKALRFANDDEYDRLMLIKQRNIDTYNRMLKHAQEEKLKAENMLSSFNQYYAKHKYTEKMYKREYNWWVAVTIISCFVFGFSVLLTLVDAIMLIFTIPLGFIAWPLILWGKKIKKKKALGDQLEKDKVRLTQEYETKRKALDLMIKEWNK